MSVGPQTAFSQHLHARDARKRFGEQLRNARRRRVEWALTFEEWWAVWEASGKWPERGRLRGQFCMSRYGDKGAYAPGNVFIQERSDNDRQREASRSPESCRARAVRGSKHRWAKFTEAQVEQIRARLAAGERTGVLAAEYDVWDSAISNIKYGRTWKRFTDA
jgi:hypothetical protein